MYAIEGQHTDSEFPPEDVQFIVLDGLWWLLSTIMEQESLICELEDQPWK